MVGFGQSAWVDDVAAALERRLAAVTGLPRERVMLTLARPEDLARLPPAERFVALGMPDLRSSESLAAGGGAALTAWAGTWPVHVFVRLATDRELTAEHLWRRDPARGLGSLVYLACQAVQIFAAARGEPDDLTSVLAEPARVLSVRPGSRGPTGAAWATVEVQTLFRTDFTLDRRAE